MQKAKNSLKKTDDWYSKGYYSFVKTASWVDLKLKQALKPYGITHTQLNILSILEKGHPKPMDAKSIKEKLIVQSPDVTRLIDRLVKKELVDRKTCPENRRKIDISITQKGKNLFNEIHEASKKAVNNFFSDNISSKEAKELYDILKKIN